jgi:DNA-binding transcriptional ArsR family regulator
MKDTFPYEEAAGMLKVIAHPVRLAIIRLLKSSRMNVNHIQSGIGLKQSITSQHLNIMAGKGILRREKQGNEVFYSINMKEVFKLMACIEGCCEKRQRNGSFNREAGSRRG